MEIKLRLILKIAIFLLVVFIFYEVLTIFRALFYWENFPIWGHWLYLLFLTLLIYFIIVSLKNPVSSALILNNASFKEPLKIKKSVKIGSSKENDIVIPFLSERQWTFNFNGENWEIIDVGSSSGTILNNTNLIPYKKYLLQKDSKIISGKDTVFDVFDIKEKPSKNLRSALMLFFLFSITGFLLGFATLQRVLPEDNFAYKDIKVSYLFFHSFPLFLVMLLTFILSNIAFIYFVSKLRLKNIPSVITSLTLISIGLHNLYFLLPQISFHYGNRYLSFESISGSLKNVFYSYITRHNAYIRYWIIVCLGLLFCAFIIYLFKNFKTKIFAFLNKFHLFKYISFFFAAIAILITIFTILVGNTGGREHFAGPGVSMPKLFLPLGFTTVQSIDIVKVCLLLFISFYFSSQYILLKDDRKAIKYWTPLILWFIGIIFVVLLQRDFGGALILLGVLLLYYYVFFLNPFVLTSFALFFVLFVFILYIWHPGPTTIIKNRIDAWLFPFHYGEQIAQSLWAISSGGFFGKGMEDALSYIIPDIHSDLPFCALGEWGGLWLLILVLILYLILFISLCNWAKESKNLLWRFFLVGIAILFGVQSFLIIGGAIGLLPLTGITLPFISHGGSSLIIMFFLFSLAFLGPIFGEKAFFADAPETVQLTEKHLKKLSNIMKIATLFITLWLFFIMVLKPGFFGKRRIYDTRTLNILKKYIEKEVFVPVKGTDKVKIERNKLLLLPEKERYFSDEQLQKFLKYFYVKDDEVLIDLTFFSRASPFNYSKRQKGEIIDALGKPLATTNEKRKRWYPLGEFAFHPIGYAHPAYGTDGLEDSLSNFLTGKDLTFWQKLVAFKHNIHSGATVQTTLLGPVQAYLSNKLGKRKGSAVVLNIKTGEILALVSTPSINPNNLSKTFESATKSYGMPFLNRAIKGLYFPGSLFKIVLAAAALEKEDFDINKPYICKGKNKYNISCAHNKAHGKVSLYSAFYYSCNSYFSEIAVELGEQLIKTAENLGFNKVFLPPIDTKYMKVSPSIAFKYNINEPTIDFSYNSKLLAQCGIGQNLILSTPLHLAFIVSAIANEGSAYTPTIIKKIYMKKDGKNIYEKKIWESKKMKLFKPQVAENLLYLMEGVFEEEKGTAHELSRLIKLSDGSYATINKGKPPKNAQKVKLAGKTGTAEVENKLPHSWMAVIAPAEDPEIAVIVLVENSGWGASFAGPIAVDVVPLALNLLKKVEK